MTQDEDHRLDKILTEVEKINRGLYGDPENKVKGLMQEHYELKDDVQKIKENEKKKAWFIAAFSSGASFGLPYLWELVKNFFQKPSS